MCWRSEGSSNRSIRSTSSPALRLTRSADLLLLSRLWSSPVSSEQWSAGVSLLLRSAAFFCRGISSVFGFVVFPPSTTSFCRSDSNLQSSCEETQSIYHTQQVTALLILVYKYKWQIMINRIHLHNIYMRAVYIYHAYSHGHNYWHPW